jgi:hypothetical protein
VKEPQKPWKEIASDSKSTVRIWMNDELEKDGVTLSLTYYRPRSLHPKGSPWKWEARLGERAQAFGWVRTSFRGQVNANIAGAFLRAIADHEDEMRADRSFTAQEAAAVKAGRLVRLPKKGHT